MDSLSSKPVDALNQGTMEGKIEGATQKAAASVENNFGVILEGDLPSTSTSSSGSFGVKSNKFGKATKIGLGFSSLCAVCGSIFGAFWLSQEFSPVNGFNRDLEYMVQRLADKVLDLEGRESRTSEEVGEASEGGEQSDSAESVQEEGEAAKTGAIRRARTVWSYWGEANSWYSSLIKTKK